MDQNNPTMKNGSHGAVIGSIIVIAILILGGIYIVKSAKENKMNDTGTTYDDSAFQQSQSTQSDSDDVSSIETDVNATNVDSLDEGL